MPRGFEPSTALDSVVEARHVAKQKMPRADSPRASTGCKSCSVNAFQCNDSDGPRELSRRGTEELEEQKRVVGPFKRASF